MLSGRKNSIDANNAILLQEFTNRVGDQQQHLPDNLPQSSNADELFERAFPGQGSPRFQFAPVQMPYESTQAAQQRQSSELPLYVEYVTGSPVEKSQQQSAFHGGVGNAMAVGASPYGASFYDAHPSHWAGQYQVPQYSAPLYPPQGGTYVVQDVNQSTQHNQGEGWTTRAKNWIRQNPWKTAGIAILALFGLSILSNASKSSSSR